MIKFFYSKDDQAGIVKALGLVFGDIGTSPIYTLTVIFLLLEATPLNIIGIISLVIWTLIIIVFIEYVILVMSLDIHGEGGTLILRSILEKFLKNKKGVFVISILAFLGVSLILGEGVITPAISVLSAVEGARLIPGCENLYLSIVLGISMVIAVLLFIFQSRGTDKIASRFGPIMIVWFVSIGIIGLISSIITPEIFKALNPFYAVQFMIHHGWTGFFLLSQVILCATGSEALYADMGHLGRKPIVHAWNFVFISLVLCYMGQGAILLRNPEAKNLLFTTTQSIFPVFYIPFLIITILATVIASQALISGVFSIVYQGISSGIFPRMRVDFTSNKLKSQIYIGTVNWLLMFLVLLMMIIFKKSEHLAVAYGLSVTGSMVVTGTLISIIFFKQKKYFRCMVACIVVNINVVFFFSNMIKIPHGGYWSLILAAFPFFLILLWTKGQSILYRNLRSLDLETFLVGYGQIYNKRKNIPGSALFFVGNPSKVSPYIIHCIVRSRIIYTRNIFLAIRRTEDPHGIETKLNKIAPGLESFEVIAGYKEVIDIEMQLKKSRIEYNVIFYGVEEIHTENLIWRLFSIVKKITPSFVQYYKIPATKLHGIVSRIEM